MLTFISRDFETDIVLLILRILPSLTARKGYIGRARLIAAYRSYHAAGNWKNGSPLLRGMREIGKKHGFSETQIAEWDVMFTVAAVTNAIPISFWMLSFILADPELNISVRDELNAVVKVEMKEEEDGGKNLTLDPRMIRENCPLLTSIWDEMLRFTSQPTLGRYVTTDTIISNSYLLKSGSVVQIPTGITHTHPAIWGSSSDSFDPRRFLKNDGSGKEKEKARREEKEQEKAQRRAFTPFGGGKNLCPGRHAAANETLSFVAMMMHAFTVENKDGTPFKIINAAPRAAGASVPKAEKDIEVVIRLREELSGVKLGFASGREI
jgi:cytochrome P450